MIITQKQNRNSKSCDFSNCEKTIADARFIYVSQTPLTMGPNGKQYTEIVISSGRILLERSEVEKLQKRLTEITLPKQNES